MTLNIDEICKSFYEGIKNCPILQLGWTTIQVVPDPQNPTQVMIRHIIEEWKDGLARNSLSDLQVMTVTGDGYEAFKKLSESQVVPKSALDYATTVMKLLEKESKKLLDKTESLLESDNGFRKGISALREIIGFTQIAITASLITGLVGSYFTSKEEYTEYKKTKFCFNALLVIGVTLNIMSALHTRSTLSNLLRP